jgi:asparagine synthase (glutamine-hydrolysing)
MCGIAGVVAKALPPEEVLRRAAAMGEAQCHRGPDDCGLELVSAREPTVALSHRRLSIIDTSVAGHQPMHDPTTGSCVVFNGEIYNFPELRDELRKLGCVFRTRTDTEVLLKAYAEWGSQCVTKLRGMFAFGIWDPRERSLLLARDQLGVKPLYYFIEQDTLVFSSEVRAILASEIPKRKLDPEGLRSFLSFGSVQDPQTLVSGVRSLLPGHTLIFHNGSARINRYWRLPESTRAVSSGSQIYKEVAAILEDATRAQMVSDVPLGAFLSGGIDSTAVVALMSPNDGAPIRTSSIVFDEPDYDERAYSRLAAAYLGTDHTELLLRGDDVRAALPKAIASFDQPSMDGLNTYFVSKVTKEAGLSVALSGVGGDELFGGYQGYRRSRQADKWAKRISVVPEGGRHLLGRAIHAMARTERARRAADFLEGKRAPYFLTRQAFGSRQIDDLLIPELATAQSDDPPTFERIAAETAQLDPINRASAFELQTYMLSTLLRDTDQMSMAHALEVRVPLLDHRLVEFIFQIPGALKVNDSYPKPLLTRSLGDSLPKECVLRPKKGFELPFARWLRGSMEGDMRESLTTAEKNSPFRATALEDLWHRFESDEVSWSRVWGMFVLRQWMERHRIIL